MRRLTLTTLMAVSLILITAAVANGEDYVEGEVLVKCITEIAILEPGPPPVTDDDELNAVIEELGVYEIPEIFDFLPTEPIDDPNGKWVWEDWLGVRDEYRYETYYLFKYNVNISPPEAANLLAACDIVDYAEPEYFGVADTLIPNDPIFVNQWYLYKIKAPDAWDYWPPPFRESLVAVVDHGIVNHTDLVGNLVPGYPYDEDKGLDEQTDSHFPYHGTMVSGIIAAVTNNGYGMAGVGFNHIKVMPVNVTLESDPFIAKAILWAALIKGADVENFSWKLLPGSNFGIIHKAIQGAYGLGVVMCASKGNDAERNGPENQNFPSDWKEVIAVTGTDENDGLWHEYPGRGSNWGPDTEFSAPARNIISTWYGSYFITESGTSFSAPHISAAAALIQAHYRQAVYPPPDRVALARTILKNTVDNLWWPWWDEYYGWGRLNLDKLMDEITYDTVAGPLGPYTTSRPAGDADVKAQTEGLSAFPAVFRLYQNYPNPAAGTTSFKFDLPERVGATRVTLEVYDLSGRRVATVLDENFGAGSYERQWDCSSEYGQNLPAGVYVYRLRTGADVAVRKVVVAGK